MRLKTHDLEQLTEDRLRSLGEAEARLLLGSALLDLREALDRLNQGPGNSARPSGSLAPFERGQSGKIGEDQGPGESGDTPPAPVVGEAPRARPEEQQSAAALSPRGEQRPIAAGKEATRSASGNDGPQPESRIAGHGGSRTPAHGVYCVRQRTAGGRLRCHGRTLYLGP